LDEYRVSYLHFEISPQKHPQWPTADEQCFRAKKTDARSSLKKVVAQTSVAKTFFFGDEKPDTNITGGEKKRAAHFVRARAGVLCAGPREAQNYTTISGRLFCSERNALYTVHLSAVVDGATVARLGDMSRIGLLFVSKPPLALVTVCQTPSKRQTDKEICPFVLLSINLLGGF